MWLAGNGAPRLPFREMARDPDERRAKKIIARALKAIDHVGHLEVDRLSGPTNDRTCRTGAVEQIRDLYAEAKYAQGALPKSEHRRYAPQMKRAHRQVRAVQQLQQAACSLHKRPSREYGKRERKMDDAIHDFNNNTLVRSRKARAMHGVRR